MGGCDDFLTQEMESYIDPALAYGTEVEADMALTGMMAQLADSNGLGTSGGLMMNVGIDETFYNRPTGTSYCLSTSTIETTDTQMVNCWTQMYSAINLANLFISSLKVDNFTETVANNYLAEARFVRAVAYHTLVGYWAEVPLRTEATDEVSDNNCPASSVADVYELIEEDLLFCAENLYHASSGSYTSGHANSMAARAMLARAYLKMAGYPMMQTSYYAKALEQCQLIIADGYHELRQTNGTYDSETNNGYKDLFTDLIGDTYYTKEVMFEFNYLYNATYSSNASSGWGSANGLLSAAFETGMDIYAMVGITPLLYKMYEDGGFDSGKYDTGEVDDTGAIIYAYEHKFTDSRAHWNCPFIRCQVGDEGTNVTATTMFTQQNTLGKYRGWNLDGITKSEAIASSDDVDAVTVLLKSDTYNKNNTSVNSPYIRYADVLLMAAEAEYRVNGANATAYGYLNQIRTRAGLSELAVGQLSASTVARGGDFFEELVDERMKELVQEPTIRHFDIKRWSTSIGDSGDKRLERSKLLDDYARAYGNDEWDDGTWSDTGANQVGMMRIYTGYSANPAKYFDCPYPLTEVTMNSELDQKIGW